MVIRLYLETVFPLMIHLIMTLHPLMFALEGQLSPLRVCGCMVNPLTQGFDAWTRRGEVYRCRRVNASSLPFRAHLSTDSIHFCQGILSPWKLKRTVTTLDTFVSNLHARIMLRSQNIFFLFPPPPKKNKTKRN